VASTAANGVGCVDEFITESTGRGPSKLHGTRFRYSTNNKDGYGTTASRASRAETIAAAYTPKNPLNSPTATGASAGRPQKT
jgi:hypothetical protein